jgi:sugar phosphate isomerase/epimerase
MPMDSRVVLDVVSFADPPDQKEVVMHVRPPAYHEPKPFTNLQGMFHQKNHEKYMPKKIAVCSWSLQPTHPADLASKIGKTGLLHTQLALDPLTQSQWKTDELLRSFADNNIHICSAMMTTIDEDYTSLESIKQTGGLRPDQHWEQNLARAKASAQLATQLNLSLISLHAGFIPPPNTSEYTTITDRIKALNEVFQSNNITLALETGQEHAEDLLRMLDLPNMDTVAVNFDPANMILYAMGNPAQAIELLKPRIAQVHMKDATATTTPGTWGAEVPAGQGEVDWQHFFSVINTLPDIVNVVIEREAGDNRINDIITARTIAEQYLGTA